MQANRDKVQKETWWVGERWSWIRAEGQARRWKKQKAAEAETHSVKPEGRGVREESRRTGKNENCRQTQSATSKKRREGNVSKELIRAVQWERKEQIAGMGEWNPALRWPEAWSATVQKKGQVSANARKGTQQQGRTLSYSERSVGFKHCAQWNVGWLFFKLSGFQACSGLPFALEEREWEITLIFLL